MIVLFSLLLSKCLVNREEMLEPVGIAWVVDLSKFAMAMVIWSSVLFLLCAW